MCDKKPFVTCPGCGAHLDHGERCDDCNPRPKSQSWSAYTRDMKTNTFRIVLNNGDELTLSYEDYIDCKNSFPPSIGPTPKEPSFEEVIDRVLFHYDGSKASVQ